MKDGNVSGKKIGECADFERAISLTGKQFKLIYFKSVLEEYGFQYLEALLLFEKYCVISYLLRLISRSSLGSRECYYKNSYCPFLTPDVVRHRLSSLSNDVTA